MSVRFDHFCSGLFGLEDDEEGPERPRFSSSSRCAWSFASRDLGSLLAEEEDEDEAAAAAAAMRAACGFGPVEEEEGAG